MAVYYKDLKTYIFNQSTIEDFSGVPLPPVRPARSGRPTTRRTRIAWAYRRSRRTAPVAMSRAIELTASIPFSLFSDAARWLRLHRQRREERVSDQDQWRGHSDARACPTKVINTTLYYEKYGFSARVSNRYRDDFIGEVPNSMRRSRCKNVSAESLLDAQIGYEFQSGALKGLSVSLSGTNLTDEPFVLNNVDTDFVQPRSSTRSTVRSTRWP